ncbi:MAG: hypothetical protein IPI66_07600 [Chitinophagaceae bacterium]|nr:hypothetical protein [Chitinophagaceae bacterium]
MPPDRNTVVPFSPTEIRNTCTKLMKEEPIKEGFLSPDEHLVDCTAIHR